MDAAFDFADDVVLVTGAGGALGSAVATAFAEAGAAVVGVDVIGPDDEDFLLGRPERYDSLTAGAGFSGHGFRFASALGEILADLVVAGETEHDVGSST